MTSQLLPCSCIIGKGSQEQEFLSLQICPETYADGSADTISLKIWCLITALEIISSEVDVEITCTPAGQIVGFSVEPHMANHYCNLNFQQINNVWLIFQTDLSDMIIKCLYVNIKLLQNICLSN